MQRKHSNVRSKSSFLMQCVKALVRHDAESQHYDKVCQKIVHRMLKNDGFPSQENSHRVEQ